MTTDTTALTLYAPSKKPRSTAKNAHGWTPDQEYFQAWLATPSALREYKDQRALAKHLEVSEWALGRWKHLPGFGEAVIKYKQESVRSEHVSAVIDVQIVKAIAGADTKAAKLVLQVANVLGDTQGQGNQGVQVVIINDGKAHDGAVDAISE